jgi:VanZ family protein
MNRELLKARVIAVLIVLTIIGGSSVPGKNIPEVFYLTPDKLIHCLEYAVLGFFLFRWLRLEYTSNTTSKTSFITLFLGTLMGVMDENYQRLTPGRSPDIRDWMVDSLGVCLSILVCVYIGKRKVQKGK